MEEILLRFPNIGDNIFKELDCKDFCKSKEVGRSWKYFINNERALQKSYKNHIKNKIQSLTEELRQNNNNWGNQTPFHLAAERGYLPVCRQIMENIDEKNPKDRFGYTPLHKAAGNGHLSVCQLIVENVDDKNPKDDNGETPLHEASKNGHLSVCQQIVEYIDDKNHTWML